MKLQSILEPQETIVYSTQGESFAEPFIALLGLMAGGSVLTALIQPGGVWTIVGMFLLLVALVTFTSRKAQPVTQTEILITDRRILYRASGRDATVIDLPLSDVTGVSWSEDDRTGTLCVNTEAGIQILPAMREPDALALAIAEASNNPPPPPIGRMLNADLLVPGSYLMTAGALYELHRWILAERWIATLTKISIWQGIAVEVFALVTSLIAAVALAVPIGRLLGVLLTVTLMKPCVTAEEMRIGLNARNPDRWHRRAALRWAGMLYGAAWTPAPVETAMASAEERAPST